MKIIDSNGMLCEVPGALAHASVLALRYVSVKKEVMLPTLMVVEVDKNDCPKKWSARMLDLTESCPRESPGEIRKIIVRMLSSGRYRGVVFMSGTLVGVSPKLRQDTVVGLSKAEQIRLYNEAADDVMNQGVGKLCVLMTYVDVNLEITAWAAQITAKKKDGVSSLIDGLLPFRTVQNELLPVMDWMEEIKDGFKEWRAAKN